MISWRSSTLSHSRNDALLTWLLAGLTGLSAVIVVFIAGFVANESLPVLRVISPWRLLTDSSWHPLEGAYGLLPMLVGTLLLAAGALLLAVPLGVVSAIFCNFYAPGPVARAYRGIIELLAGIPSVIYGLWGLVVLVPLISRLQGPGTSLLAGILVLALMILPTMAMVADTSLAQAAAPHLQGAAALGLSRWTTVRSIVLPAARSGLLTGALLQMGRAAGETMAMLMVCGNVVQLPSSLFEPIRPLTANIALEMAYAMGNHRAVLFASGLALFFMVLVPIIAAELLGRRRSHG
jgi:phosphate transport system permease protein